VIDADRNRVEQLFYAALDKQTPAERDAFLDSACSEDAGLRATVEGLLHAHDNAGTFLDSPVSGLTPTREKATSGEPPGTHIGPYKILQQIGEGGFGAVYLADQEEPVSRKVALKIIKLGMDTRQVIARFEAERQALALMDHPNIARVFDAGATETGRPFFVMELVRGVPITEYCDQHRLSLPRRLRLFLQVCNAVQHAHQKGVIHRDIKPNNVLVTLHDDQPVPKVIDFGIAKATSHRLTKKTLFTEFRQFIGTPEYMSPDQAEISGLEVDTRTDIYSLGVLLYELLTGTTPFDPKTLRQADFDGIKRIIREVEPPRPSTRIQTLLQAGPDVAHRRRAEAAALPRLIRGDLDWIVVKALEKDRTRRYQTASDLAGDIERHLNHEPVLAGPPGVVYKFRKFIRRNQAAVFASSLVIAALVTGLVLATTFYFQAAAEREAFKDARDLADREAARAQAIADYLQDLLISTSPEQALGQNIDVDDLIAKAREVLGQDHAAIAATLSSRALQLIATGDVAAAEPLYRESLRIWREHYSDDHVNIALTLGGLGRLLEIKGDAPAAEQAFREALEITRDLPAEQRVVLSESRNTLAGLLRDRGEYEEAETLIRESIDLLRSARPQQRLQIALSWNLLINVLMYAGDREAARDASVEAVAAFREAMPSDTAAFARICTELGVWNVKHGFYDHAEPMLRQAVQIFHHLEDAPRSFHHAALAGLFSILREYPERLDEAVQVGFEAVEVLKSLVGEEDAKLGAAMLEFCDFLADHERFAESLTLLLDTVVVIHNAGDLSRLDSAVELLNQMAWRVVKKPARPRAVYELARKAVEMHLYKRPNNPPALNTLGVCHFRLGAYELALEYLAQSDAYYAKGNSPGVPADVAFLAMAHHQLGNAQQAREAMTRLRQIMQQPSMKDAPDELAFLKEATALLEGAPHDAAQEP
jgi:serine/threonine protein kinase/tetratricopeptide (TPR) repeat protein